MVAKCIAYFSPALTEALKAFQPGETDVRNGVLHSDVDLIVREEPLEVGAHGVAGLLDLNLGQDGERHADEVQSGCGHEVEETRRGSAFPGSRVKGCMHCVGVWLGARDPTFIPPQLLEH